MKTIPHLQDYKIKLIQIFNNTLDIEILTDHLKQLFIDVLKYYCYMRLPKFEIIPTKNLQYIVWYQEPNSVTETLNIRQENCDLYLWRSVDDNWYLDDLYSNVTEISEQILKNIPVFHSIPENPKEVKTLLENGLMNFNPEIFPKFSEKIPNDLDEILTWDDRFLLVGTKAENLKIYSHQEWDEIIQRENFFQDNDGK